ncbi:MAG: protein kinase domain-containing protein [Kiritimatiellia bacterium]
MADRHPTRNGEIRPVESVAGGPGPGFRIGEYTIEKKIGHGAMGTVYLSLDGTGHEVALKLFQEGPGVSATMLERFRREAEAAKKLRRHPNIMKVYATGHEGPYHFIVMEPVRHSRTLDDLIGDGPTNIQEIVGIIIKVARALGFAHSRNVVHRDVKPGNIMINEFGEPLLSDFGVAAMIDWPGCTMTGSLTGTPLYMSPEQARSERVGPESDIYSLAAVLYESITGQLPYSARHSSPVKSVLEAVKNEMPARPRAHRRDISPDLEAIIMKALEKDPADRYPDAESFAIDLERALAGRHVSAHLFTMRDRIAFRLRRHRQVLTTIAAIVIVFTAVSSYFQARMRTFHVEHMLKSARLRDAALRGSFEVMPAPERQAATAARQEWLVAVREMNRGNFPAARSHLASALQLSRQVGDRRIEFRAEKELARMLSLDNQHEAAMTAYKNVIDNPETSTADLYQARLEALILALMHNRHADILPLIQDTAHQPGNMFRQAVLCLTGEISVEDYRIQIDYLPARLQNDARLALAVRLMRDGDRPGYLRELQQTIRGGISPNEWPAPLARKLYEESR